MVPVARGAAPAPSANVTDTRTRGALALSEGIKGSLELVWGLVTE